MALALLDFGIRCFGGKTTYQFRNILEEISGYGYCLVADK